MWLHIPSAVLPSAPEQVGSSSECLSPASTSDGDTGWWVQSSGTPTQRPASWRGWKTRPWIRLLCGMTSPPSTVQRGVARWISSLRGSPASRSPRRGSDAGSTTSGGSGRWLSLSFATRAARPHLVSPYLSDAGLDRLAAWTVDHIFAALSEAGFTIERKADDAKA